MPVDARAQFATDYNVSRQKLAQFDRYIDCVIEAQARMNLVARSTLPDIWTRHICDSAQLLDHGHAGSRWLDLGAGAGFPGIVLAILGAEVDMIESIGKKAAFLREVIYELGLAQRARVFHGRIESLSPWPAPTIVARALAPLHQLFDYALKFAAVNTRWVLPKGARVENELVEAGQKFAFNYRLVPSRTLPEGRIVIAHSVMRKGDDATRDC